MNKHSSRLSFLINGECISYTTAYARKALQEGIDLAGKQMVYCDTDSIKTLGPVKIEKINDYRKKLAKVYKAVETDRKGHEHYIGIFEYEGMYDGGFISCGAKRYAYIQNGRMHITVSGVTKQEDEETTWTNPETGEEYHPTFAEEELGALENFHVGMKWDKAGGVGAVYRDNDDFDYTDPETGEKIHVGKNVVLVPTTYEMTYEKDYAKLLMELDLYGEYLDKRE